MSWWPFEKHNKRDPLAEVFERAYQLLKSESLQNELLPDDLRKIVARAPAIDKVETGFGAFGLTLTNPIPTNGALGEVIYLSMLRHKSGMPIVFHRLGSVSKTDVFEVTTIDGRFWDLLYLDMYHPRKSTLAPDEYGIAVRKHPSDWLLRGTTIFLPNFPHGIYDAVVIQARNKFGIEIADPALKVLEQGVANNRPARHTRFLETLRLDGRLV